MTKDNNYIVQFKGLSDGSHEFDFEIKDDFFVGLDYSEIKEGNLKSKVILIKHATFLEFEVEIDGWVKVPCDLCLEEFEQDIHYFGKLFVKFGNELTDDDDVMVIPVEEHEIDLSHYIYESINLSLPYKKIHPEDENGNSTCDEEMLKKIEQHSISEEKENIDPRWDKLKDFLSNN